MPVTASAPNRADIALFVGFVGRRNTALPAEVWRWLSEQGWTAPPYGRTEAPRFRTGGVANLAGLAIKVREAQDPLSEYIRARLETNAPGLLAEFRGLGQPSAALSTALTSELNSLLGDGELYSGSRFQDVRLTEESLALIRRRPRSGDELSSLNYLLLKEAYPRFIAGSIVTPVDELIDLPVPIDTWEVFDWLFAWDAREVDGRGQRATTYLGAAVRSFFSQGGRKCYVVRAGDPLPLVSAREARLGVIEKLIPGYPDGFTPSPVDRQSWHGIGHLFGLPDASFLCVPDLPDLVRADEGEVDLRVELTPPPEEFVECSEGEEQPPPDRLARLFPAPRADEAGYQKWARALWLTAGVISRQQREVQLVASVPIPRHGIEAEEGLLDFLLTGDGGPQALGPLAARPSDQLDGLASAFVQLAYPWLRTRGSDALPEQVESPDAVLVGMLARNALTRGTFRSAAKLRPADVREPYPALRRDQMIRLPRRGGASARSVASRSLLERVSLFGETEGGLRLLSDVTTSLDESYRPASVNRLVSVIVRAARRLGEELVFEASGERLWAQLSQRLNGLLAGLFAAGALRGEDLKNAFNVRCDRSTMSQNDIDNGRVIAYVQFEAAAPIERITVVLAMDEGGQISLVSTGEAGEEKAA